MVMIAIIHLVFLCSTLLYFYFKYIHIRLFPTPLEFKDKNVVIVGGSSGIGLALGKKLLSYGIKTLVIISSDRTKLKTAKSALLGCVDTKKSKSIPILTMCCDVAELDRIKNREKFQKDINSLTEIGRVDYLFFSQGIFETGYFLQMRPGQFQRSMFVNYLSNVFLCKIFIPEMIKYDIEKSDKEKSDKEHGKRLKERHIVFIGSIASTVSYVGYTAYSPTKYALKALAEGLENEFLGMNFKFHIAFPSVVDTPMHERGEYTKRPETREINKTSKVITPEKCADYILNNLKRRRFYLGTGLLSELCIVFQRMAGPLYRNSFWFLLQLCLFSPFLLFFNHKLRKGSQKYLKAKIGFFLWYSGVRNKK